MLLVRGLHILRPEHRGCGATIGNFDGGQRGHQAIQARLRERPVELGVPSCVVFFEPQPRVFFDPETEPARLASLRDKLEHLSA
ncbi:bifunctional riboflavin kinase/FAD synthetase, partial [Pseudomonas syringae pv. tagetis]